MVRTAPTMEVATVMADKEPVWNAMFARQWARASLLLGGLLLGVRGLRCSPGSGTFSPMGPKARRSGFHEHAETEGDVPAIFDDFRRRRVIP